MLKTGIVKEIFSSDNDNTALLIELSDGSQVLKFVSDVSDSKEGITPPPDYAEDEKQEVEKDPADYYTEQALSASAPIFESWLGQIESNLFDGAESLEEVRDRIESVYSELDAADFASLMQNLLLAGFGAGHYQVQRETADDEEFAEDTLEYARLKLAGNTKQQKTCTKGFSCGYSCVSKTKSCAGPLPGQGKNYADWLSNQIKAGGKLSPTQSQDAQTQGLLPPPTPVSPPATAKAKKTRAKTIPPAPTSQPLAVGNPIKTNAAELDNKRADLVKRLGQKQVENAEKNVQKILNSADTQVYIRVSSADTLEKILGDRFRNSVELGKKDHDIPHLKDDYDVARKRVEAKSLGYDDKNTSPEDRPTYGYFGSNDLKGASHAGVSKAYGSIAVKLKKEVKSRTTFTGDDSLSGKPPAYMQRQPSTLDNPSVASVLELRESAYKSEEMKKKLQNIADSKNLGDAAKALDSNYIEAQVHGKVRPEDIGELIYLHNKKPSQEIIAWAKTNNVKISYK